MFDLSLIELGVIALVALLVLGPERLPKAARTVGFYVRKARQSWFSVRAEFEREIAAEELKRSLKLDEIHATLDHTAAEVRKGLSDANPAVAGEDDGLTAEERARQLEAAPAETDTDTSSPQADRRAVRTVADTRSPASSTAPSDASDDHVAGPSARSGRDLPDPRP